MSQIGSSFVYRAKRIMITREVFDRELQRIRPTLVQIAQRHLNDADEAEDTVQEVMLRLWQRNTETICPKLPNNYTTFCIIKYKSMVKSRGNTHGEPKNTKIYAFYDF